MANNETEAAVPSTETPATDAAVEAGATVENAVVASAEQGEYVAPTAEQQADIADDTFGGESDYVVAEPATEEGPYEPQGIIAARP